MFLKSLYDYAQNHHLLDDLPLQRRQVHAIISLDAQGRLRDNHLIPLTQPDNDGKERAGQERLMPRFPGENNGGKAYFLAEGVTAVLGRDKSTGEPILARGQKANNQTKAFENFWEQIQQAYETVKDHRLEAMLIFRKIYFSECEGRILSTIPFLEIQIDKKGGHILMGKTAEGKPLPLRSATLAFSVDGQLLTLEDENDPLRKYWFSEYIKKAYQDEEAVDPANAEARVKPSICLLTGQVSQPIARSHKPKILGVPGLSSGGYIVSFAKEAPAFSSYGLEMGQNAPVSERAAAAYALALNDLLDKDDTHLVLGPLAICFWTKAVTVAPGQFKSLLDRAYPEQVRDFLRAPFAGVDQEVLHHDRLYTVALSGNAGRVVVQHWLDQTLDEAISHFARWWKDLEINSLYTPSPTKDKTRTKKAKTAELPPSPFAIRNLAYATLRRTKGQKSDKLIAERMVQLYRAALEGTSLPVTMMKPVLDELHSALVKDNEENPTYPFTQSRFALIKLILIRNRKEGDFMPTYELADTPDSAYNLGRLLAILEALQDKYHNYEKKGPGVVERYYSTASSAPASAFPILCRLARHHLSKVRREDDKAAYWAEKRITEVMSKFQSVSLGKPPVFPRVLTLEEQGRFALGFYQQKAYRAKSPDNGEQLNAEPNITEQITSSKEKEEKL